MSLLTCAIIYNSKKQKCLLAHFYFSFFCAGLIWIMAGGWVAVIEIKEFAKSFYKSMSWQKCRAAYIAERRAIDGGLCEECRTAPGYIVHHKILLTSKNIDNPNITLNHKKLKFVCKACHEQEEIHIFNKKTETRCTFNDEGCPIPK